MSMSGITISDDVAELYKGVKMENGKRKYMILKLSDDKKQIVVEHCPEKDSAVSTEADQDALLAEFVEHLKTHVKTHDHKCGYGIVKAGKKAGGKITFVSLIPDNEATIKMKMLYASVIEPIRQSLEGIQVHRQLNDTGDLSVDDLKKV